MPYTPDEQKLRSRLKKEYGEEKGVDIYNKLIMGGHMGEDSKRRMVERSAKARRAK